MLLESRGAVVTREQLFDAAWGGAVVGDDSLNRAINRVRRIAAETGPGLFEIETIPRTGYRLTCDIFKSGTIEAVETGRVPLQLSRRLVMGSAGAAGLAAVGGMGLWLVQRSEADRRFNDLFKHAEEALLSDEREDALRYSRAAVAMRPNDARAQGLFANAELGELIGSEAPGARAMAADRRARVALELDPNEPYALLTRTLLQRSTLDMAATEDRLRRILAHAPNNITVMRSLWSL